jgi:hypothetical protein
MYYPYYGQEAGTSVWTSPPTARPLLVFGSAGPVVVEWQQFLNSRGFPGEDGQPLELVTTIFGKNTQFATESFQRSVGFTGAGVDGKVGKDTWRAADKVLVEAPAGVPPATTETTPGPGTTAGTFPDKPGTTGVSHPPPGGAPGTGALNGPRDPERAPFFTDTTIVVGAVALAALGTLVVLSMRQPGQRYT